MTDKPIQPQDAITFLREAALYFERRPTGGEDAAFWANDTNAQTCLRIADMITDWLDALKADDAALERLKQAESLLCDVEARFPNWRSFRDLIDCIDVTLHQARG